jgi:hypothetical protein
VRGSIDEVEVPVVSVGVVVGVSVVPALGSVVG